MTAPDTPQPLGTRTAAPDRDLPVELINVGLFSLGILLVVMTGAWLVERFPSQSPWVFASAYGGPAILAFAVYWMIARRLRP